MACYVLGTIYKDLKKTDEAEKLYKLAIESKLNPNTWDARVYTGLSNILSDRGEYDEALKMGNKGLKLLRDEDNRIGVSRALNDLGSIYHRLKEYDKALEYIFESTQNSKRK
jgi:tetratricopeptide (TPR) repeat protein